MTQATGRAEPQAAMALVEKIPGWHRDQPSPAPIRATTTKELVQELRDHLVTPHLACSAPLSSMSGPPVIRAITRSSQCKRKRINEIFGWLKTVAGLRKTHHRGVAAGRLDIYLRAGRLQSGQDAQLGAGSSLSRRE